MNLGDWGAGCNGPNVWGPRSRMWNPPTPLTISGWSCGGEGTRWRPGTRIRVLRVKRDVRLPVCRAGTRWEAGRRQPAAGAPPGRGLRPWTPACPVGPRPAVLCPGPGLRSRAHARATGRRGFQASGPHEEPPASAPGGRTVGAQRAPGARACRPEPPGRGACGTERRAGRWGRRRSDQERQAACSNGVGFKSSAF